MQKIYKINFTLVKKTDKKFKIFILKCQNLFF